MVKKDWHNWKLNNWSKGDKFKKQIQAANPQSIHDKKGSQFNGHRKYNGPCYECSKMGDDLHNLV